MYQISSSSEKKTSTKNEEKNVISFDSLLAHDRSMYISWSRSPYKNAKTRSSSTDCTVYGFTSSSSAKKKKVSVSNVLASCFEIRPQIYILEVVTAKYELKIDGLSAKKVRFSPNASLNCGLYPDYTEAELNERGYSISQRGDDVTLAAKMIHIISDTNGIKYDKWYPCSPSQLEWSYNLYINN